MKIQQKKEDKRAFNKPIEQIRSRPFLSYALIPFCANKPCKTVATRAIAPFAKRRYAALGKGTMIYTRVFNRLQTAVAENDMYGIFYNVLHLIKLARPHGQEMFDLLKNKFKNRLVAMILFVIVPLGTTLR
jgi:hypothetical protein